MGWWVLLGYVFLSPALGLLVGSAIRMQGGGSSRAREEESSERAACTPVMKRRADGWAVAAGM